MRRRKRKQLQGEVELNLAAMLDMAFQLLAFFILTFRPAPLEGYIALRMPPPQATTKPGGAVSSESIIGMDLEKLQTLMVTVRSSPDGGIGSIQLEEGAPSNSLSDFEAKLNQLLGSPEAAFEQVILKVGSGLHYDSLVRLLDVCSHVKLANGEQLTKLSFSELPEEAHIPTDAGAEGEPGA